MGPMGPIHPGRIFVNGNLFVALPKKWGGKNKMKKESWFFLQLSRIDPSERLEDVNFIGGCRPLLWFKVDSQNGSRVLGLELDMVTSA